MPDTVFGRMRHCEQVRVNPRCGSLSGMWAVIEVMDGVQLCPPKKLMADIKRNCYPPHAMDENRKRVLGSWHPRRTPLGDLFNTRPSPRAESKSKSLVYLLVNDCPMLALNTAPSCYISALRGYSSDEAISLLYCQSWRSCGTS